jgi:predicted patatin/cPLA2 family phospholipase
MAASARQTHRIHLGARTVTKQPAARPRHPVIEVLAERAALGSRPGARSDAYRVALAIEGGGMRGTLSAGMALRIHELGLLHSVDAVYGASAGAISAAWLISSRPEGLRGWTDPRFAKALIRKRNPLRGRPIVDVERLVEEVYLREFPLDYASVLASPIELHPLATDVLSGAAVDLHPDLTDAATLRLAMRASAALPVLAGRPVAIGARRFYDAGLAESVPFRQALADEATHVLVLRSKSAQAIPPGPATASMGSRIIAGFALRGHTPQLRAAFLGRATRLADDERALASYAVEAAATPLVGPAVLSIRPDPTAPTVNRLETDSALLHAAFETGRHAVDTVLATGRPRRGGPSADARRRADA